MKKQIIMGALLMITVVTTAQKGRGGATGTSVDNFNPSKDFYYRYSKVFKKSKSAGLVKGALHFKKITSDYRLVGKGQDRTTTKAWAILKGVSDHTMQQIADEFAVSFAKKIASAGISMTEWASVTSAKNFAKLQDKQIKKEKSNTAVGYVTIKTAHQGPHLKQLLGNPGTIAAYKRVAKDIGADAMVYDIVIDFARFDIDAKRWKTRGYGPGYDFQTTAASANVMPQVGIMTTNGATGLGNMSTNFSMVNKDGLGSTIQLMKNIFYNENYATDITSHDGKLPESMKRMITFNTMTTGTFVIQADETKYKTVVLKALDQYTDHVINLLKSEIR